MEPKGNADIHYGDISTIIQEDTAAKVIRVINSTFCYAAAFIIVNCCFQFATGAAGHLIGFKALIRYYSVTLPQSSNLWILKSIIFVYSAGTAASLVLGVTAKWLFNKFREKKGIVSLFFFWLYIHGVCLFLVQWIVAAAGVNNFYSPFYTNLAIVASWMGFAPLFYAMALVCLVTAIVMGISAAEPLLGFSFSRRYVLNYKGRKTYFSQIAFLPFLAGSAITFPLSFPGLLIPALHLCTVVLVLMIGFIRVEYLSQIEVSRNHALQYLNWRMFFLLIMLMALSGTVLREGISL